MLKKLFIFLAVLSLMISFIACDGTQDNSGSEQSSVDTSAGESSETTDELDYTPLEGTLSVATQFRFYGGSSPDTGAVYDYFNTYHPDLELIEYNLASADSAPNYLTVAAVSGEVPDVYNTITNDVDRLIRMDAIYSINDYLDNEPEYKDSLWDMSLDLMKRGDNYYGVSSFIMPRAIMINKEIFDRMGVDYPSDDWTIDEFIDTAVRLTDKSMGISGMDIRPWNESPIHTFLSAYGVKGYKEVDGVKISNLAEDQDAITALEKFIQLTVTNRVGFTTEEYTDLGLTWSEVWESGNVAMSLAAPWALPIDPEFDELFFDTMVVRLPQGPDGKRGGYPQNHGFAMHPASENKDLAWEYMKLLTSKHFLENAEVKDLQYPELPATSYLMSEETTNWGPGLPGIELDLKTRPDLQPLLDGFISAIDDLALADYGGLGQEYLSQLGVRLRNVYDGKMQLMEALIDFDNYATTNLYN